MIKVVFKSQYGDSYKEQEYTYKDYEGAAVGDIVVVNTRNGYAIAKITQVDTQDCNYTEKGLSSIVKTIISQKEILEKEKAELKRKQEIETITAKLRKAYLVEELGKGLDNAEKLDLIKMSNEDLEEIYKNLKSF